MSVPTCINLEERFGRRYRVTFEAGGATKGQWAREDWPWIMEIRGRYGVVYPKGGEILQGMTDRPRMGRKLRALPCVRSVRGDAETIITFRVADAEQVFALLKPYRRRQVSETERERLRALSARHGFPRKGAPSISERDETGPETTIAGKGKG
jgi:hypothetical protein